jgi:hypothetical protein
MFMELFEQNYNMGWQIADMFSPSIGGAVVNIIVIPLALIVRWLVYGLLAYLFARWLGGTAELSDTLGVLALAVAPQVLNAFNLLPYISTGNLVSIWGILCAYVGIKTAHKLPWHRAAWATLLPFLLFFVAVILVGCLGSSIFAAIVKGG